MDEGLAWCGGGRFGEGRQGWLLPVAAVVAAQSMILLVPWMDGAFELVADAPHGRRVHKTDI